MCSKCCASARHQLATLNYGAYSQIEVGRQRLVNVRFGAHYGLKSDIAPSPRSAIFGLMHRSKDYLFDPPIGNGKARRNDQATQIKLTVLIRRSVTLRT